MALAIFFPSDSQRARSSAVGKDLNSTYGPTGVQPPFDLSTNAVISLRAALLQL